MSLRLAFMGTPDFAVPTLAELIGQGHEIACVYTQQPRARGRGLAVEISPVQRFAQNAGLAVRTPVSLKGANEQAAFAGLETDAAVVVAYGLILPTPVLDAPRLGCINLHPSLLPRWRGAAPMQRAIMAGDAETGVMTMRMAEGLDSGPVLMAERVPVGRKTHGLLHEELKRLGADLMARTLSALERGALEGRPQDDALASYAKKIDKAETRIDWRRPAEALDCHIRGLSPAPGAWFEARGERIKLLGAEPAESGGVPGTLLPGLRVACGTGALKLILVQRAGRAPADAEAFSRGFALPAGEMLS
jgi:methionyl-tRNA formyltransferase